MNNVDVVSLNQIKKIKGWFAGVMGVLVPWDTPFIIDNCSLDWWNLCGMGKYTILPLVAPILPPSQIQVPHSFSCLC